MAWHPNAGIRAFAFGQSLLEKDRQAAKKAKEEHEAKKAKDKNKPKK